MQPHSWLRMLGRGAYFADDAGAAHALGPETLAVAEAVGDCWLIACVIDLLRRAAHFAGDYAMWSEGESTTRRAPGDDRLGPARAKSRAIATEEAVEEALAVAG